MILHCGFGKVGNLLKKRLLVRSIGYLVFYVLVVLNDFFLYKSKVVRLKELIENFDYQSYIV